MEAQEYALWSLSLSVNEEHSRHVLVSAGSIADLVACIDGKQWPPVVKEHAAAVRARQHRQQRRSRGGAGTRAADCFDDYSIHHPGFRRRSGGGRRTTTGAATRVTAGPKQRWNA